MRAYFDHMATTPVAEEVLQEMLPYLTEKFGNPSRANDLGEEAKDAVEKARERVAELINAAPEEIIFTSSGAEANNLAIHGLAYSACGKHIISSVIEHHSVLNALRWLQRRGFVVSFLSVDKKGVVDTEQLKKSTGEKTCLISIMLANYEVGTLQQIKDIVEFAHERGVLVHTDAVACAGNIHIDVRELGVDALSISSHTIYGPKGAGALYLKSGTRLVPLIYSGIQENGYRGGTENVPAIVGFGKACELAKKGIKEIPRIKRLRDLIVKRILDEVDEVVLTGHPEQRLPNHASFIVKHIDGEALMQALNLEGVYIGNGTACISQVLRASPVLIAMGYTPRDAQGHAIFTLGRINTLEQVEYAIEKFKDAVNKLRAISPFGK